MTVTKTPRAANRSAVTLIELLVVLSIIAILAALTGVAIRKTATTQRYKATTRQVLTLQQSLDKEYEDVVRQCAADRRDRKIPQAVIDYCDGNDDRAQAVWTAMRLRQQFPATFAEAASTLYITFDGASYHLRDAPTSEAVGYVMKPLATFQEVSGATGGANESAALLYIILAKKSVSGGGAMASSADELGLHQRISFGAKELEVFMDPLGRPIGFNRWNDSDPVQGAEYRDTKYTTADPLDPRGLVFNWPNAAKKGEASAILGFNNRNRLASVNSQGLDDTTPADDIMGYVLRRDGK